ncbi:MAG: ABC transporter ATP-binding protein [Nitrospinota bacterium]
MRTKITIRDLTKEFPNPDGSQLKVFEPLSLEVTENSFVSLLGPSGCGKSTVLNIVAGLESPTLGEVFIDGTRLGGSGDQSARIGYVFQTPRLLNWLTVRGNIEFALEAQGVPRGEWRGLTEHYVELVGLRGMENHFPLQLSGGMQQRVGIARALAISPDIVLMDEPFSHLDEITAKRLRTELVRIWRAQPRTILFVTHDLLEAVFLSDKLYMMTSKPSRVFHTQDIRLPRTRQYEDRDLIDLTGELLKRFYAEAGV